MNTVNNLIEMIELKKSLNFVIEQSLDNLTVNEYNTLKNYFIKEQSKLSTVTNITKKAYEHGKPLLKKAYQHGKPLAKQTFEKGKEFYKNNPELVSKMKKTLPTVATAGSAIGAYNYHSRINDINRKLKELTSGK